MRGDEGGGGVAGSQPNEYSCVHGTQKIFGDLTPYLTYAIALNHEAITVRG